MRERGETGVSNSRAWRGGEGRMKTRGVKRERDTEGDTSIQHTAIRRHNHNERQQHTGEQYRYHPPGPITSLLFFFLPPLSV